jgi:hypothetical protein
MGTHWPGVARRAMFYKAVVQSMLLYGSKTWNLTKAVLAWLEGFHIHTAYRMGWEHTPCKGLFGKREYPLTKGMIKECGLHLVKDYIDTCSSRIAMYVVNQLIFIECKERERWRGSMPCQWWWE